MPTKKTEGHAAQLAHGERVSVPLFKGGLANLKHQFLCRMEEVGDIIIEQGLLMTVG